MNSCYVKLRDLHENDEVNYKLFFRISFFYSTHLNSTTSVKTWRKNTAISYWGDLQSEEAVEKYTKGEGQSSRHSQSLIFFNDIRPITPVCR